MKKQDLDLWAKTMQTKMNKTIQDIGDLQNHLKDLKQKFDGFSQNLLEGDSNKTTKS